MRVGQRRRQEELKVLVIGDITVTKLNDPILALLGLLLEKDRLKSGVERLTDVL